MRARDVITQLGDIQQRGLVEASAPKPHENQGIPRVDRIDVSTPQLIQSDCATLHIANHGYVNDEFDELNVDVDVDVDVPNKHHVRHVNGQLNQYFDANVLQCNDGYGLDGNDILHIFNHAPLLNDLDSK